MEDLEDQVVDAVTASRTAEELRAEIAVLDDLVAMAKHWTRWRSATPPLRTAYDDAMGKMRRQLTFTPTATPITPDQRMATRQPPAWGWRGAGSPAMIGQSGNAEVHDVPARAIGVAVTNIRSMT